jgi:hypothetical protein
MKSKLFFIAILLAFVRSLFAYETTTDAHNQYLTSDISPNFRVILGKDYPIDENLSELIDATFKASRDSWQTLVEDMGFMAPNYIDNEPIDIYIDSTDAYNYVDEKDLSENTNLTLKNPFDLEAGDKYTLGYASLYAESFKKPYFVFNKYLVGAFLDEVYSTTAHEFFHTIQGAYYYYGVDELEAQFRYPWWDEATAMLAEDLVYPDINSYADKYFYKSEEDNFFVDSTLPIDAYSIVDDYNPETDMALREYSISIYARYLYEKYGIEFIMSMYEIINQRESFIHVMAELLMYEGTDLSHTLQDFTQCLIEKDTCFEEGTLYPDVKRFTLEDNKSVGAGGVLVLEATAGQMISSNPHYPQQTLDGQTDLILDTNATIIISNATMENITSEFLYANQAKAYEIQIGWNMFANIYAQPIDLTQSFVDATIIWIYQDNKFQGYSNDTQIKQELEANGALIKDALIPSGAAFWVKSETNSSESIAQSSLASISITPSSSWQFQALGTSAYSPKVLQGITIWTFKEGKWFYYCDSADASQNSIEMIEPYLGYFIKEAN